MIKVAILTVSDSCTQGKRQDAGGPAVRDLLAGRGFEIGECAIVPDDQKTISDSLRYLSDEAHYDIVLTTGGTGLGPRDVTPEATVSVCERLVPGFSEMMRIEGLKMNSCAILSRGVTGIRGNTLVINLPGSPQAVRQCLGLIVKCLPHAIEMLRGGGHPAKGMEP